MGMKDKCKCEEGAPLWVMTFGDMMSLLLTFFILLVSMSEIKQEDQFRVVADMVKKSFGVRGGGGRVYSNTDPEMSLQKVLEELEVRSQVHQKVSNSDDPGIEGRRPQVTRVRKGWIIDVGGKITFEPLSDELTEDSRQKLLKVAEIIRDLNNKVEIRGHTSNLEDTRGSPYDDSRELSYARAAKVEDFLISKKGGNLRSERMTLVAVADREPLVKRAYDAERHRNNRRVEIVLLEAVVDDMNQPEPPE